MFRPLPVQGIKRISTSLFTRSRLFPSFPQGYITYHQGSSFHKNKFYYQVAKYSTQAEIKPNEGKPENTKTEVQKIITMIDEWVKENTQSKNRQYLQFFVSYFLKPVLSVVIFVTAITVFVLNKEQNKEFVEMLITDNFSQHKNTGVTFADVKGIDSCKAELELIVEFLKNPKAFQEIGAEIPKGFFYRFNFFFIFFYYFISSYFL